MFSRLMKTVLIGIILTGSSVSSNDVTITSGHYGTHVTITCTVTNPNATSFMIHLSCPVLKNGYCYSNCSSNCSPNVDRPCYQSMQAISKCEYRILSPNSVSTSYQINRSQLQKSGDWKCNFKHFVSSAITLEKDESPVTTTMKYIDTVTVPIKTITEGYVNIYNPSTDETTIRNNRRWSKKDTPITSTSISHEINFLDYMRRPELVLVLIFLLGASLLLNLSFLIRCVLLKSVIENYYRGIPNNPCLLECLCLDLVSYKYMHRRYSRSLNLSNQVGSDMYRCQALCTDNTAIYDDLSAVSNSSARMKMRSNHSSELEEETRLTNVMPNGGCHINQMGMGSVSSSLSRRYTNPSHAAYFHPGLGNYVIVSGPTASHDQYSIGTAPSGYAIQMVSPIPSAPGSIGGGVGTGTHMSASSAHSDESDNDSRTALSASMASGIPNRTVRVNSQPIDLRDSGQRMDFMVPFNGLDQSLHCHHENQLYQNHPQHQQNHIIRSNGSVPLHPWPIDSTGPIACSVSSLPYYSTSENGVCNLDLRNKNINQKLPSPPKDVTLVDP